MSIELQPGLAQPEVQFAGQFFEHGCHARFPLALHVLQGILLRFFDVRRDCGSHGFLRRLVQLGLQGGE